jgi:peptidoglycan/LPS O-acetylase OafA/YrhL
MRRDSHPERAMSAVRDTEGRVFGLDLVRATAVALVLVAHASYLLEPVFPAPRTFEVLAVLGVELFFVLSGFLIGGIIIDTVRRDARWLGNFWVRRWLRTLPNYFVFLAFNVALFHLMYRRWPVFGSYVVFAQGLAWPHPQFFTEAWSLAIEEIFYLLAPVVAMALLPFARSRARVLVLLLLAVASVAAFRTEYVLARNPDWDAGVRKVSLVRLDCIVSGVIAAYACRRWRMSTAVRTGLAASGLGGAAYSAWLLAVGWVRYSLVVRALFFSAVPAAFAALLPLTSEIVGDSLPATVTGGTRRLALWSYSLYLTNLPVLRLVDWAGLTARTRLGCVALFAGDVAVAVGWAALNYRWLERPIMAQRDRVATRLGLALPASRRPARERVATQAASRAR